jgi:hypothetical protein
VIGLVRRLVPELGAVTVAGWAWRHRGTVVRSADLALRSPTMVRDGRTHDVVTEARAVAALDAALPRATSVRISGIDDGTVLLHGDPGGRAVTAAREALCDLPGVNDVRSDGVSHPTADALLQAARPSG